MGNLNLPTIASGQSNKYQTSNDADNALDLAVTEKLSIDLTAGNVTLTAAQFVSAVFFKASGGIGSPSPILTVPAQRRLFVVYNDGLGSPNGPFALMCGSTALSIEAYEAVLCYTDGSVDGLVAISRNVGTSGPAGGVLTGTYPDPGLASGAVTLDNIENIDADSILGNNTGSPARPLKLTPSQVKSLLTLVVADVSGAAPLAGPTFTGAPAAPTAAPGTNTTQLATTAFIAAAIAGIVGGLVFKGAWNANLNSPTITSGSGTLGWFYKVGTAGTTTVDGISSWNIGDQLWYDGAEWLKVDGITSEVVSVAGLVGTITAAGLKTALAIASGDVSGLAASATTDTTSASNISSGSLALARIATQADTTILGNNSGGSHVPIALTAAQVKTLLAIASSDVSGLATSATTDTTSASNITSGTLAAARVGAMRAHLKCFYPGVPSAANALLLRDHAAIAATLPTSGSKASAGTACTADTTFTIKKNGGSVGTILYAAAGTTGAFTIGSPVSIAIDDIITIVGPATADLTLADISITLATTAAGA